MASEIIITDIRCLACGGEHASIRRDKSRNLFMLHDCGQLFMRTAKGQGILQKLVDANGGAKVDQDPAPAETPAPKERTRPKPKQPAPVAKTDSDPPPAPPVKKPGLLDFDL